MTRVARGLAPALLAVLLLCVQALGAGAATAAPAVGVQEKVTASKAAFVGTIEQVLFVAADEPPRPSAGGRTSWTAFGRVQVNERLFGVWEVTREVYVALPAAGMNEDQVRAAFETRQLVFFGELEPAPRRWTTSAALLMASWWNGPEPVANLAEVRTAIAARFPDRPASRRGSDLILQASPTDSVRLHGQGDAFECDAPGYENVDKVVIAEMHFSDNSKRRLCRFDSPGPEPERRAAIPSISGVHTSIPPSMLDKVNQSGVIFVGTVERVAFVAGNAPPAATTGGRLGRVAYAVTRVEEVLMGDAAQRTEVYAPLPGIDRDEEQMRRTYGGRKLIFFGHLVPSPPAWKVPALMLMDRSVISWKVPEPIEKADEVRRAIATHKARKR